jgi:hypothetical protein
MILPKKNTDVTNSPLSNWCIKLIIKKEKNWIFVGSEKEVIEGMVKVNHL